MLSDTAGLLNDMCVKLGFFLPPDDQARIVAAPPGTVEEFTDEVIRSEGLDPATYDPVGRKQVRQIVADYFGEPRWDPKRRPRSRR